MTNPSDENDSKQAGLFSFYSSTVHIHVNPTPKPTPPAPAPEPKPTPKPTPLPLTTLDSLRGRNYIYALAEDAATFLGAGVTPDLSTWITGFRNYMDIETASAQESCYASFWKYLVSHSDWGAASVVAAIEAVQLAGCATSNGSPPTIQGATVASQPNLGQLLVYAFANQPSTFFTVLSPTSADPRRRAEDFFADVITNINSSSDPSSTYNTILTDLREKITYDCNYVVSYFQTWETKNGFKATSPGGPEEGPSFCTS